MAEPLSPAGWILMIASLSFVVALTGWCYWKVLNLPREVPKQAKDFHSA
jgi:hypothetical protein